MQIHGPSHVFGTQPLEGANRVHQAQSLEDLNGLHGADQIDISPEAEWVGRAGDVGAVRSELVEQIRQQIAAGTYDSSEKLDIAVGRMLDEILG